ncbi:hypothetical protein BC826DRAFT_973586 [Russula brevipes]|nr:hypothetical protein BC826DRAFT_973586 [Russula brevipes]
MMAVLVWRWLNTYAVLSEGAGCSPRERGCSAGDEVLMEGARCPARGEVLTREPWREGACSRGSAVPGGRRGAHKGALREGRVFSEGAGAQRESGSAQQGARYLRRSGVLSEGAGELGRG